MVYSHFEPTESLSNDIIMSKWFWRQLFDSGTWGEEAEIPTMCVLCMVATISNLAHTRILRKMKQFSSVLLHSVYDVLRYHQPLCQVFPAGPGIQEPGPWLTCCHGPDPFAGKGRQYVWTSITIGARTGIGESHSFLNCHFSLGTEIYFDP